MGSLHMKVTIIFLMMCSTAFAYAPRQQEDQVKEIVSCDLGSNETEYTRVWAESGYGLYWIRFLGSSISKTFAQFNNVPFDDIRIVFLPNKCGVPFEKSPFNWSCDSANDLALVKFIRRDGGIVVGNGYLHASTSIENLIDSTGSNVVAHIRLNDRTKSASVDLKFPGSHCLFYDQSN
jgi:hypothetical protein